MISNSRHQKIFDIIQKEHSVSTKELVSVLYASEATIRRDLSYMEQKGLLKRVHGGAILIKSSTLEESSLVREQTLIKEKRRIAIKALEFIQNGNTIFIDPSTTAAQIIPFLSQFKELSIITNGIHTSLMLIKYTSFDITLTNGRVNYATSSTIGSDTVDYIRQFNANVFLFSSAGISIKNGVTEVNLEQMRAKQAMMEKSARHILLIDHAKFDKIFFSHSCDFSQLDVVITDKMPDESYIKAFEMNGVELIIA